MKWYSKYYSLYGKNFSEIPEEVFDEIAERYKSVNSSEPLVTVSVIGYNEEKHLASCLWSLVNQECDYPFEIIGVDNDSKDKTAEVFKRCGVEYFTETRHSCGWARQCGLEHARGRFHLNIDSDTIYPPKYVQTMAENLLKKDVVAACSSWSYVPDEHHSAVGLFFYETFRDIYLWFMHFKRPELAVRGLVFGYRTDLAQKIGIRTDIIRGEDGSLAIELKKSGKIVFIHRKKARAITGYGTMDRDNSFSKRFADVIKYRLKHLSSIFSSQEKYEDRDDNMVK